MDLFAAAYDDVGLSTNTEKTVVGHRPPLSAAYYTSHINVNGSQLQAVDGLKYMGSTLSHSTEINDKVASLISKYNQTFGRLQNTVWNFHDLHHNAKLETYEAVFLPTAAWGGDLEGLHDTGAKAQPSPSQLSSTNTEAEMVGPDPRHDRTVTDRKSQHPRHAETTAPALERPPHVATGSRRQGDQVRCCNDNLKTFLKSLQTKLVNWEDFVRDRPAWRLTVEAGAAIYGANRVTVTKSKQETRKSQVPLPRNANLPTMPADVPGTNRSRRTSSDAMRKQPGNAYSPPTLTPAAKPAHNFTSVTADNRVAAPGHQPPTSSALPQPLR
nr:unnamed protein product [Spirometra erinaceieuropaei]